MAATAIWKNFRLEDEYRRLMGDKAAVYEPYAGLEGRRVVSATNVFAADAHALPSAADLRLRELYPRLVELSRESCYVSESTLKKMATELRTDPSYAVPPAAPPYVPAAEPCMMGTPTPRTGLREAPLLLATDAPSVHAPTYLQSDNKRDFAAQSDTLFYNSVDRLGTRRTYDPIINGSFLDSESVRPRALGLNKTTTELVHVTPVNARQRDFGLPVDFLSAFQAGGEPRNDYGELETPIVEKALTKSPLPKAESLVSQFSFEKSVDATLADETAFTPRARAPRASEVNYPSYVSKRMSNGSAYVPGRFQHDVEIGNLFDTSCPPRVSLDYGGRDFNLNSPIRSIMRESNNSYGFKNSHTTPRALFHNLL
ncbi:phosphoglucomutase, putative [Babesia caballi]|uniref:Phosphoglucomutase, putative n=1 Tax=Babesia caballi TaxID=5871 RepID=A0AAV4LLL7_BABCB|nr:phosphoglucomutase, putative [Babesia caballi]